MIHGKILSRSVTTHHMVLSLLGHGLRLYRSVWRFS